MFGRSIFPIHKGPFLAAILLALPIAAEAQGFFGGGGAQLVDALPDHCTAGQLFVVKPAVGLTSNLGQQMYYCTATGSATYARLLAAEPLANPGTPYAVATGGPGIYHYAYQVVAYTSDGAHTAASGRYPDYPVFQSGSWYIKPAGSYLLNSTLNGTTRYNDVAWSPVPGASFYRVYQIINDHGQGTGLVTDVITGSTDITTCGINCILRDGGSYTAGTPPTTNTTGRVTLPGGACDPADPSGSLCGVNLRLTGNATVSTACPVGAPAGSVCAGGKVYAGGVELGTGGGGAGWTTTALGNISGNVTLNVGSTQQVFTATLTGDVVLTTAGAGSAAFVVQLTQDGTGNHLVTCDTSFRSCGAVASTASAVSIQSFTWNGTAGIATPLGPMTSSGGSSSGLDTSAGFYPLPPSPGAAGVASGLAGLDSGAKLPAASMPAPSPSSLGGVQSITCASSQHISQISTGGVPACTADSSSPSPFGAVGADAIALKDDFPMGGLSSGSIGELNWRLASTAACAAYANSSQASAIANHPGYIALMTDSGSATSGCLMNLAGTSANVFASLQSATWEEQWVVAIPSSTADGIYRLGLADFANNTTATSAIGTDNGIYVEFAPGTDTHFTYHVCAASSCVSYTSSITVSTSSWYRIRIRSNSAGTALFSVSTDGGAFSTEIDACSGCTLNRALPTSVNGLTPMALVLNTATQFRKLWLDWFGVYRSGLVR